MNIKYMGLAISPTAVGWAVTDENYKICRVHGDDLWGIRLFEKAETAEKRRLARLMSRRLYRQWKRVRQTKDIFRDEIHRIDSNFFIRLQSMRLQLSSGKEKTHIFNDPDFHDKEFHQLYPTMYHVRKELIENPEPHDVRLVYLAIIHMMKKRGHFLYSGEVSEIESFPLTLNALLDAIEETLGFRPSVTEDCIAEMQQVLKDKSIGGMKKKNLLVSLFNLEEDTEDIPDLRSRKKSMEQICKLLCGLKGNISKIVQEDIPDISVSSFSYEDSDYADYLRDEIEDLLPEEVVLFDTIKAVYDWTQLSGILMDEKLLSTAKVKAYDIHHNNLRILHLYIKKYCHGAVNKYYFEDKIPKKMEDEEKKRYALVKNCNYPAYVGKATDKDGKKVNKCKEADFYSRLVLLLNSITPEEEDREMAEYLLKRAESHELLPLQTGWKNFVIPMQLNKLELEMILKNASGYLPFLNEKDEDGYTVKEKILAIFCHKVPYYVGPISDKRKAEGGNVWFVRKKEGLITPWNFNDMIDFAATNRNYIHNLSDRCVYFPWEDRLPLGSLYHQYARVLDFLNSVRVREQFLSPVEKEDMFRCFFLKHKKVTRQMALDYIIKKRESEESLTYGDISCQADFRGVSMASYLHFKKRMGWDLNDPEVFKLAEDLILLITVYGNERAILSEIIETSYPGRFSADEKKNLMKLKTKGNGFYSKRFLTEVSGADKAGHHYPSLIYALEHTAYPLKKLMSSSFTFEKEIESLVSMKKIPREETEKRLMGYIPFCYRRALNQTIRVVDEIIKAKKQVPKRFFFYLTDEILSSPEDGPRKERLLALYKNIKTEKSRAMMDELRDMEERTLHDIKVYLYFLQMGRCLYTGKEIPLSELLDSNCDKWRVGYLYPLSVTMDDSIDNMVLVSAAAEEEKGEGPVPSVFQKEQNALWEELQAAGLLIGKKLFRLKRDYPLSDREISAAFRSYYAYDGLVADRVISILKLHYPDSEFLPVKKEFIRRFRKRELDFCSSTWLNDYRYAKDAYLAIVTGNSYHQYFMESPSYWLRTSYTRDFHLGHVFESPIYDKEGRLIWSPPVGVMDGNKVRYSGGTLDLVKKTIRRVPVFYTEYSYCGHGQIFDLNPVSHLDNPTLPLKEGLPMEKYGGYKSVKTSHFILVETDDKKGNRVLRFESIPIYIANRMGYDPDADLKYLETIGYINIRCIKRFIKKNALILVNGYPMHLRGAAKNNLTFSNGLQALIDIENEQTLVCMEEYYAKGGVWEPDLEHDGFDRNDVLNLYDALTEKIRSTYKEKPSNIGDTLLEHRDDFIQLDTFKPQAYTIRQILLYLTCSATCYCDLSCIGGKSTMGGCIGNRYAIWKKTITLVDQSASGIYESKIVLNPSEE